MLKPEHLAMLKNKHWRLNNLYWITDKEGKPVRFKMTSEQLEYFEGMRLTGRERASNSMYGYTMVPIHDSGFKFNWRDPVFNKGSALSSLADAQSGSVDDVRRQYVDYIWEGFRDAAGNVSMALSIGVCDEQRSKLELYG